MGENSANDETARDAVEKWLRKQGYPFELRVGRGFEKKGWYVQQTEFYKDVQEDKVRHIDVYAIRSRFSADNSGAATLAFTVECKRSQVPWVVFSSPPSPVYTSNPERFVCGTVAQEAVRAFRERGQRLRIMQCERMGHGIVAVTRGSNNKGDGETKEGKNFAFDAMREGVSGAMAKSALGDAFYRNWKGHFMPVPLVLPVVVYGGELFEVYLDAHGEKEVLQEINHARVICPIPDNSGQLCVVNVVTPDGLPRLVDLANADAEEFLADVATNASAIVEKALPKLSTREF